MDADKKQLIAYIQWASNLAESVRRDIQRSDSKISTATVLALNEFVTAANAIKDITDQIDNEEEKNLN